MWDLVSKVKQQAAEIKNKVECSFEEAIRNQDGEVDSSFDTLGGGHTPIVVEEAVTSGPPALERNDENIDEERRPTEITEDEVQRMLAEARANLSFGGDSGSTMMTSIPKPVGADNFFDDDWGPPAAPNVTIETSRDSFGYSANALVAVAAPPSESVPTPKGWFDDEADAWGAACDSVDAATTELSPELPAEASAVCAVPDDSGFEMTSGACVLEDKSLIDWTDDANPKVTVVQEPKLNIPLGKREYIIGGLAEEPLLAESLAVVLTVDPPTLDLLGASDSGTPCADESRVDAAVKACSSPRVEMTHEAQTEADAAAFSSASLADLRIGQSESVPEGELIVGAPLLEAACPFEAEPMIADTGFTVNSFDDPDLGVTGPSIVAASIVESPHPAFEALQTAEVELSMSSSEAAVVAEPLVPQEIVALPFSTQHGSMSAPTSPTQPDEVATDATSVEDPLGVVVTAAFAEARVESQPELNAPKEQRPGFGEELMGVEPLVVLGGVAEPPIAQKSTDDSQLKPTPSTEHSGVADEVTIAAVAIAPQPCGDVPTEQRLGSKEEMTREDYRHLVLEFYRKHNPDKLAEVDGLLLKYQGKEHKLYSAICKKYGIPEDGFDNTRKVDTPAPVAVTSASDLSSRFPLDTSATHNHGTLSGVVAPASSPVDTSGDATPLAPTAFKSWFAAAASAPAIGASGGGPTVGSSGAGFFKNFTNLTSAAEAVKKNVERQFEDAVRSQEETSAFDAVHHLRGAVGSVGAAPAEMPSHLIDHSLTVSCATSGAALAGNRGGVGLPEEAQRELEQLRAEKSKWQEKEKALLEEGTRLSKRVFALEAKAKEVIEDYKRSQEKVMEGDKVKVALEAKLAKLSVRAASAEAQSDEQRSELRNLKAELSRCKEQLQGEQGRLGEEQQLLERRCLEQGFRIRALEEQLDAASRERSELIATNQHLAASLDQARNAADAIENRFETQRFEAARQAEEQQQRLEEVELEFARQSLPYAQKLAALEEQVAVHARTIAEREGEVQRRMDEAQAREAAAIKLVEEHELAKKNELEARQTDAKRLEKLLLELAEYKRQASAAWAAQEMAERSREDTQAELRFQIEQRSQAEKRVAELQERLDAITHSSVPNESTSAEQADARRLKVEVETLRTQREELHREAIQLQSHIDGLRREATSATTSHRHALLEQKFEAALQMIGQLQEALETTRAERDAALVGHR